jgi:hypothetical protein
LSNSVGFELRILADIFNGILWVGFQTTEEVEEASAGV